MGKTGIGVIGYGSIAELVHFSLYKEGKK